MICKSCNNDHKEKYCPNCGEKRDVEKITLASMMAYAFSSVTNMDKGFLFNLKTLTIKPQKIITEYISGKRKGILNPISFLIFSITIYIIVIELFKTPNDPSKLRKLPKEGIANISFEVGLFLRTYLKYFWVLSIVPLGLSLKLIFRKYNFTEYLATSSFVIGQATLVGVISFLIFRLPLIFDPVIYFMIFWMVYRIFKDRKKKINSLLLAFVVLILFIIQLCFITLLIGLSKA